LIPKDAEKGIFIDFYQPSGINNYYFDSGINPLTLDKSILLLNTQEVRLLAVSGGELHLQPDTCDVSPETLNCF
jgi:hypothetical protein